MLHSRGGDAHMGSCLSEGMVSSELAPPGFRMLLKGCPAFGYAWAYLLGNVMVSTSLQINSSFQ